MTITAQSFELNQGDQFIFALDVSASMGYKDCPGGLSRIEYAKEKAKVFAKEAGKYDPDGADYFTFGSTVTDYLNQTPEAAVALIDGLKADQGSTDTAGVIARAWDRALELRGQGVTDNIVLMIITDGEPKDREAVKTQIRNIADTLQDRQEFGIIFLTIGEIDAGLQSFLTDLDDNLNAKHDIVDVKKFESVDFEQAFVGAIAD
jgi:Mg-chelatase subunit ChlD